MKVILLSTWWLVLQLHRSLPTMLLDLTDQPGIIWGWGSIQGSQCLESEDEQAS